MIADTTSRELKHIFSEEEMKDRAERQARLFLQIGDLEKQKKEAVSGIAAKVNEIMAELHTVAKEYSQGYIYKEITCTIRYNFPEEGKKQIIRKDTAEVIATEEMSYSETEAEKQLELPLPDGTTEEQIKAEGEALVNEMPFNSENVDAVAQELTEALGGTGEVTAEMVNADEQEIEAEETK